MTDARAPAAELRTTTRGRMATTTVARKIRSRSASASGRSEVRINSAWIITVTPRRSTEPTDLCWRPPIHKDVRSRPVAVSGPWVAFPLSPPRDRARGARSPESALINHPDKGAVQIHPDDGYRVRGSILSHAIPPGRGRSRRSSISTPFRRRLQNSPSLS